MQGARAPLRERRRNVQAMLRLAGFDPDPAPDPHALVANPVGPQGPCGPDRERFSVDMAGGPLPGRAAPMSRVRIHNYFTSLDGFAAGTYVTAEHPIGDAGALFAGFDGRFIHGLDHV